MHTRGRYSPLTDGSTHAKSDNKTIQCTLEADIAHSELQQETYSTMRTRDRMPVYNKTHGIHSPLKGGFSIGGLCQITDNSRQTQLTKSEVDSITLMGSTKMMS